MSLLFNMLSRFIIAFLPRSRCHLISWLQSSSAVILEPKKIKSVTASTFPLLFVMGPDAIILVCLILSFKQAFSVSSFTLIKRLFSSSSLSAIRVVSSAYLRYWYFSWQSWFQLVLHPFSMMYPAFSMMYSVYKLNKHSDNIQPWHTPFPIWNQFVVPCPILTVVSWPTYRFLRSQVRWSDIPISWRIFHSLSWSTQSKALV